MAGYRPGSGTHGQRTDGPETAAVRGIRELLTSATYTVGERSDHVGLRLTGPVRHPAPGSPEIVSHGVPIGAIELPPSEELIVLQRSRALTAGYPVAAIATRASLPLLGQAGPGRRLRFRWRTLDQAVADERAAARELDVVEARLASAYSAMGLTQVAEG
ncbi:MULTISPECIES: hypothetical protein [unclassified Streptomyces]|uniref:hypothetical protein n=1 Tax=unclassified Streptomyces TaxID=2593676 RepID=UPI002DDA2E04|nr:MULTISPECIES: hypothetical protein [unclassified Streptomyces]WSA96939.1 hypothetical protein OIE63_03135 [Streptomyces sp. NBC_01795]WSB81367.1 hypothetical protein OHB04_03650 [Streptomyces sp. NBC_01775]WSS17882.1 hypothetical protein OG533_36265 [Streptomyces sp. NBC_01186]WSS46629.1 hypothetical protein OG220_36955 [Streptomyces sp. NBC_01187]